MNEVVKPNGIFLRQNLVKIHKVILNGFVIYYFVENIKEIREYLGIKINLQ